MYGRFPELSPPCAHCTKGVSACSESCAKRTAASMAGGTPKKGNYMDKTYCKKSKNHRHGNFKRSSRKHKAPGRIFVICGYCGMDGIQSTKKGVLFDTNPAKNQEGERATVSVSSKLTPSYYKRIPDGITIRELLEFAIDNYTAIVIQ